MAILLTDGHLKNALAILRALGKAGHEVYCVSKKRRAMTFYSKYCCKRLVSTDPQHNPTAYGKQLLNFVKHNPIEVIIPVGLNSFNIVSKIKKELSEYTRVPVVGHDTFMTIHDKNTVNQLAQRLGIPVPISFVPKTEKELKDKLNTCTFPLVIKARKGTATSQVRYATAKHDAIQIWNHFNEVARHDTISSIDHSYPIIQEYLPGDIVDVVFLFNQGKVRACLAQQRLLMYPVDGGSGALNQTIRNSQAIQSTIKLMKSVKWHGVGMAEFKRDKNGQLKLIEVNPKFWGTTECAISAGLDLPNMLYHIATNGDTPSNFKYLVRKPFGWPFPMGIRHILDSQRKLHAVTQYIRLLGFDNATDLSWSDIRPLALQLIYTIGVIVSKIKNPRNMQE